jgi:hypothetical protein
MRFPQQQPEGDPTPNQDPLPPYSAPTARRERGSTQPLDDSPSTPPRTSSTTQVGSDFANRSAQRRARQRSARVSPQRFGNMARKLDNRQIFLIGGSVIVLLIALLAWRAYSQRSTPAATGLDDLTGGQTTAQAATQATAGLGVPVLGPSATAASGVSPQSTATPTAAASKAFVVTGTGPGGLFLRADHSTQSNIVATLPEGTKVETLGPEFKDGTRTWKKVKTDKGEGWVAAQFLTPVP